MARRFPSSKRDCLITLSWDPLYSGGNSSTNNQRTQTYVVSFPRASPTFMYLRSDTPPRFRLISEPSPFSQNPPYLIRSRLTAIFAIFNPNRIYAASSTRVAPQVDWGYVADRSVLRASFLNLTSNLQRYFQCHIRRQH